jgi:hypothetical protein
MASWAVIGDQTVWISPLATAFTIVCQRCIDGGEGFPSVHGTLPLEHLRGHLTCPHGHQIRMERDGR